MNTHRAKKYLGQNFLVDDRIQHKIIHACDLKPTDTVVEIGPGQGALTRWIAPSVQKLICVETDRDLIDPLTNEFSARGVEIIHTDFLKWPMSDIPQETKVIGNIPYNISTPIIEKIIEHRQQIHQAYLTVQLEFGERLQAKAGTKEYGALTCFAQYYMHVELLFKIKANSFNPRPKVDSCFLKLTLRDRPAVETRDEKLMFQIIRASFNQRRKTLVNALSHLVSKDKLIPILESMKLSPQVRGEVLNLSNFAHLSNHLVL